MSRHFRSLCYFLCVLFILSGCATWQLINRDNLKWKQDRFEAELPIGWVKINSPFYMLVLTKDGALLQNITIYRNNLDKEFPKSKKKLKSDMFIQDIADVIVDEMSLNRDAYLNLEFSENKPVDIGGVKGFKLSYTYNNKNSMKYKAIAYGFMFEKKYYEINYAAAQQYYFENGLPDFERFIKAFQVTKK